VRYFRYSEEVSWVSRQQTHAHGWILGQDSEVAQMCLPRDAVLTVLGLV
jgi:hypothetical protein